MDATRRARISRGEIVFALLLLVLVAGHYGWCEWSLPRFGVVTAHGLETTSCNWGTMILSAFLLGLALVTLGTGVVSYWVRSRAAAWWSAQVPTLGCWAWLSLEFVDAIWPRSA